MRYMRFVLWLVAIGAAGIWFIALTHGFKGFYCVTTDHTCTSQDLRLQWHVVLWLAPMVLLVSLLLVRVSKHYRIRYQQFIKRPVAQRPPLQQQVAQQAQPIASRLSDGPARGPRVVPDQLESHQVGPSPRHAARDHFITMYDPPVNGRPRHAAPEPEPEW